MRIWHESLIPHLCQKHLCAMWREGLGMYRIVTEHRKGYWNHPATKEFAEYPRKLWDVLREVRVEMLARGYRPKGLPAPPDASSDGPRTPWQSLDEQIAVLKAKGCKCKI